jgi:hypothetical protein
MNRDIFCYDCNTYVGTIRDAKLMKGLKFLCPNCCPDEMEEPTESFKNVFDDSFGDIFGSIFGGKK